MDFGVGFEHPVKIASAVKAGEPLMFMYYNDAGRAAEAERMVQRAYQIGDAPPAQPQLILERIE